MRDAAESGRAMSLEMPSRSTGTPSAGPDPAPPSPVARGQSRPLRDECLGLHAAPPGRGDGRQGTAFGERKGRFGGAFGTSVASHALLILLFYGLTLLPVPAPGAIEEKPFDPSQLVWANVPGPGGGGGGGGNQMKEPPAQMQTKPIEKIAVPIAKPTPQTPPKEIRSRRPSRRRRSTCRSSRWTPARIAQVGTIDAPVRAADAVTGHWRRRGLGVRQRYRRGPP